MAKRIYINLTVLQEQFKNARRAQIREKRMETKYAGLKECFRNVRKANTVGKLTYCY